jgi:kynurenine formamidase
VQIYGGNEVVREWGNAMNDPATGVRFVELSHPWGHGVPIMPGDADIHIERAVYHARDGVLSQKIVANMHASTHVNAPIHLVQRGAFVGQLPIDRFFGSGVILSIPKQRWEYVTAADLDAATPRVRATDIVLIVTGWHVKHADSLEYFGEAPGLAADAAQWLIDRGVHLVGMDTPSIDHPLATSLGLHRNGPLMRRLPQKYRTETGREPKDDFPDWNPAHRLLLGAGIPTIENVGGDIADVLGIRATIHALPWRWDDGDACVVRLMALIDDTNAFRIESGATA